jgi:hypothetical protein
MKAAVDAEKNGWPECGYRLFAVFDRLPGG